MGEKEGISFEIKLSFALSRKFIDQLSDRKYELNTRKSNHTLKLKALEEKVKAIAVKKEVLDSHLVNLEDSKKLVLKRLVAKKISALTPEELKDYKSSYEDLMLKSTRSSGANFRENGWDDKMVLFMFELWLAGEIKKSLTVIPIDGDISEKEKNLKESRGQLQGLYDMGVKALREMRMGITILPKTLNDNFDILREY